MALSRRALIGAALGAPVVAIGLDGCAAAAPVVFNPVVDTWLSTLAVGIGAQVIGTELTTALNGSWAPWNQTISAAFPPEGFYYDGIYGHPVPPVVLMALAKTQTGNGVPRDPSTEQLGAFVANGTSLITFDPWAWQGLAMFVHDLTNNRTGDDLAAYSSLCALSLAPSGPAPVTGQSPQGAVAYMTYEARNGTVEISRFDKTVQISVSGIPIADGTPTIRKFDLPA